MSIPEANTVPSNIRSEEGPKAGSKPDAKPGDVHDTFPTAVGSDASVVTSMSGSPRSSLTPGSGDKGTFSPTVVEGDGSGSDLPGKPFKEEEAKAYTLRLIKGFGSINPSFKGKAKMMLEDALNAW